MFLVFSRFCNSQIRIWSPVALKSFGWEEASTPESRSYMNLKYKSVWALGIIVYLLCKKYLNQCCLEKNLIIANRTMDIEVSI